MSLGTLARQLFRAFHIWQVQAVILFITILLLLLLLGKHDDPYAIILKHERARQEALEDLTSDIDGRNEPLGIIQDSDYKPPSELFPKPKYDQLVGVERAFGYLYTDTQKVYYNRVPKAGSRSVLRMVKTLRSRNKFRFIESKLYLNYTVSVKDEYKVVKNVTLTPGPVLFERHIHFIDFTRYHVEQPIYINMIQEPATRLASWYYFIRFNEGHIREMSDSDRYRSFDKCVQDNMVECTSTVRTFQIIPFFCGQDAFCRVPCIQALTRAKRNVELYYAVVGVVDDFKGFLSVLEALLPKYFAHAVRVYEEREEKERKYSATVNKKEPTMHTRKLLSLKLKYEYEFYYYIRQRFYRLLYLVNKMRVNNMNQRILGITS